MRIPDQLVCLANLHSFLCQAQSPRISVTTHLVEIAWPAIFLRASLAKACPYWSTEGWTPSQRVLKLHVSLLSTTCIVCIPQSFSSPIANKRNLEARTLLGRNKTMLMKIPTPCSYPNDVLTRALSPNMPKGTILSSGLILCAHGSPRSAFRFQ